MAALHVVQRDIFPPADLADAFSQTGAHQAENLTN
jgi:hypothetical protein